MPITGNDLRAGDILFKHAEKKLIPKIIKRKQAKIVRRLAGDSDPVTSRFGISRTHVAMAAGPRDVLEFDEGGNGAKILFRAGYGFVRGDMTAGARRGKAYDVYECINRPLATRAGDKAELVWDITRGRGSRAKGMYGFSKLVKQAVSAPRGASWTAARFEDKLQNWLTKAQRGGKIKFFCSEFVTFSYLWAASDSGQFATVGQALGTDQSKLSPVELYHRVEKNTMFRFKGVLYA